MMAVNWIQVCWMTKCVDWIGNRDEEIDDEYDNPLHDFIRGICLSFLLCGMIIILSPYDRL